MAMDGNGWCLDNSMVINSGTQWQWMALGQLDGKGLHIDNTTTMDNKDSTSVTAMLTQPPMEVIKANVA
jgi:hypothetical protein